MFTAILFVCSVYAQDNPDATTNHKKYLLGGSMAFDFSQKESDKIFNSGFFHFNLYSGYNINPKVTLGLKLAFSYYENVRKEMGAWNESYFDKVPLTYEINFGNSFDISAFLRYQDDILGKLKYYFDFGIGTAFSGQMKATMFYRHPLNDPNRITYDFKDYYANVACGLLYLFSENAAVNFKLTEFKISSTKEDLGEWNTVKSVNAKLLSDFLQPNLGIVINF